jgi:flagellar P-ring protein precursor FlgI
MRSASKTTRTVALLAAFLLVPGSGGSLAAEARIKDLTHVQGVRGNPLVGYGIIVGLNGTGDGTQAAFTTQSVANALRRMGITVDQDQIRVRNVAAVMVTAELPPFARAGSRLDVTVSSLGDAKSLVGGTLLLTPLRAADRQVYAVAQGSVSVGGAFSAGGGGTSVQKNHPTAGRVPGGALVEKEAVVPLEGKREFRLVLDQPDFSTADRMARALNQAFPTAVARAENAGAVVLRVPEQSFGDPVGFLAAAGEVRMVPDAPARVVLNERTGTVVMGGMVRLSQVAVSHGNLSIAITTDYLVSQPAPFSEGETVTVPQVGVTTEEEEAQVMVLQEGTTVEDLVGALNALGVTPRDLIAIFQAIHQAGALHAELVVI